MTSNRYRRPASRLVLALAAAAGLLGCAQTELAKSIQDASAFIEISRDIANAAQPCFVEQFDRAADACEGDDECEAEVKAASNKMADWYDRANELLCKVMPALDGCAQSPKVH